MVICDCHVHIYPDHDLSKLLNSAWEKLNSLSPQSTTKLLFLTERSDCHFFRDVQSSLINAQGISLKVNNGAIEAILSNDRTLWIIPGRQTNSIERLEILALTKDLDLPEKLPYKELLSQIIDSGALAVINWAPGKWFARRGELISSIIDTYPTTSLLFCDTTLRCIGWPEPTLMAKAKERGFKIIAGSDPLPIANEESKVGSYAVESIASFREDNPIKSAKEILQYSTLNRVGSRSLPWEMMRRVLIHTSNKH